MTKKRSKKIASLFDDAMFRSCDEIEPNRLEECDIYVGFGLGDDPQYEINEEIEKCIQGAQRKVLSPAGAPEL